MAVKTLSSQKKTFLPASGCQAAPFNREDFFCPDCRDRLWPSLASGNSICYTCGYGSKWPTKAEALEAASFDKISLPLAA